MQVQRGENCEPRLKFTDSYTKRQKIINIVKRIMNQTKQQIIENGLHADDEDSI